jgi:hypothetical protein
MGKKGIFEYINLQKQEVNTKTGKKFISYVVVSEHPDEIKNFYYKLSRLGFKTAKDKRGKTYLYSYANNITPEMVDGLKQINAELKDAGGQTGNVETFLSELEQLKAEIEASKIPLKTKTELDLKLEEYIAEIANGVDNDTADALLQKFLAFSNQFHDYSTKNVILIYLQKPNATKVAAKSFWNEKGRQVNPQAAITINCVNKYYTLPNGREEEYTLKQQKLDREYLANTPPSRQNPAELRNIKMRKNYRLGEFDACPVFDISDTYGAELPEEPKWTSTNDNNEDAKVLFDIAKKSLEKIGVTVTQDPATAGEAGWSRGGQINVSQDVTGSNAAATIFKEWASDLLYNTTRVTTETDFGQKAIKYLEDKGDLTNAEVKLIKAIQAEAIAAAVCKHYNLPVPSVASKFKSLAQTRGGLSIKAIVTENLSTLTGASNYIITQIENYNDPRRRRQNQR